MESGRGDFRGVMHAAPPPDVISYSSAAAACQRGGAWEEALRLLKRLEQAGVPTSSSALYLLVVVHYTY